MSNIIWDPIRGLPRASLLQVSDFALLADGLDHPEGVACGPDGSVYAGGESGQIYHLGANGACTAYASTGGWVLGLALDADGNVYACDIFHRAVMRITPAGEYSCYSSGTPERPMRVPNYPVFDAAGNLYVSDSGDWNENNGCIYRIAPGGATEVWTTAAPRFPNGLAWHPDVPVLYIVESQMPGVVRIECLPDGRPGDVQTVVELPHNVPDGLAFDRARSLFISCYTPDVIYRFNFDGEIAVLAADWEGHTLATPTNIAFCGPDRRELVVASFSRWHLSRATMRLAGFPLHYPLLDQA